MDLPGLAFEAGYDSPTGFREAFQVQTGLSPSAYRRMLGSDHFTLPLLAGLRVQDVLAFQGRDGQSVSERVDGARLQKAFLCEGRASVLSLTFGERAIAVSLAGAEGSRAMARAHGAALRLLGWHGDPSGFELAHPDLARGREGLRVLLTLDPFEALVWAILGQQVNLAFAYALRRDLIRLVGVPAADGLIAHPDAGRIAALESRICRPCGSPGARPSTRFMPPGRWPLGGCGWTARPLPRERPGTCWRCGAAAPGPPSMC